MTPTEARIEQLARLVHSCDRDGWDSYDGMPEKHKIVCRNTARTLYAEIMKDAAGVARGYSDLVMYHGAMATTPYAAAEQAATEIATALEARAKEASNG